MGRGLSVSNLGIDPDRSNEEKKRSEKAFAHCSTCVKEREGKETQQQQKAQEEEGELSNQLLILLSTWADQLRTDGRAGRGGAATNHSAYPGSSL